MENSSNIHPLYVVLFKTVPYKMHPPGRRGVVSGPAVHQFTDGPLPERIERYLAVHRFGSQTDIAEGVEASVGHTRRALDALLKAGEVCCIEQPGAHPEYCLRTDIDV